MRTEVAGEAAQKLSDLWFLEKLDEWAEQEPARFAFALDQPDQRVEEYSYADVVRQANRVAAALAASGVAPGDRVGILMDNSPHWVFSLLGALRVGAVGVPLSTLLPARSIRLLTEHAGCKVVFTDAANQATALEALRPGAVEIAAYAPAAAGALGWDDFLRRGDGRPWAPAASPDGMAVLMYTSGTTGDPKGVCISARGLSHDIFGLVEQLELDPNHRILSVLPFSHVLPLVANGLGALAAGCGVVFLTAISPQRIVEAFKRHRITFFVCVPQFFYAVHKRIFGQVAALPGLKRKVFGALCAVARAAGRPALSRKLFGKIHQSIGPDLRLLITGGSRFEPAIARDFQMLGYTMIQAYGLTETSAAATITPLRDNAVGTVGRPIRGVTIRIDQPNAEGIGEVCIAGEVLMQGYYRNPEATADAIRGGWLYTGDLGRLDDRGNLTLTGRSKDVIVLSNGKNVYPEEVEAHYDASPFIKELCVMSLPDSAGPGDALHAVVVPDLDEFRRRNQTAIAEMIRYELDNRSKQLASFMRVHSLSVRNEPLPRTLTRKLKRFEIYESELARTRVKEAAPVRGDHPRLAAGVGAVVARLIRAAKPELGDLAPEMNFDLDLGFDSLARVELLGEVEAKLGVELAEERANQIFTIGELIEALEAAGSKEVSGPGRSWKEKLTTTGDEELARQYIQESRFLLTFWGFPTIRLLGLVSKPFFRTRVRGLEKLPPSGPYLLCPNHVSYLDPFLLCSVLPYRIIRDIFILGYTDYLEGRLVGPLARSVNIVPVDPNANLTRAMRVAAAGLRRDRILLIFPEGERSIDGHLTQFKKGAAILAVELGVPLVPVGIRGTFEAWPRGGSLRAHPVEITIGDPIPPDVFRQAPDPYGSINEALKSAVARLLA